MFKIEYEEIIDVPWKETADFWLRNLRDAFPLFVPEGQFKVLELWCCGVLKGGETQDIRLIVAS